MHEKVMVKWFIVHFFSLETGGESGFEEIIIL